MTDALERLKNRTRPTVRNRDTSLVSPSLDIPTPRLLESEAAATYNTAISTPLDSSSVKLTDPKSSVTVDISTLEALDIADSSSQAAQQPRSLDKNDPRNQDTQISVNPDTSTTVILELPISENLGAGTGLKTKQSTLRLEQGVGDRLQDLCREQGICREVLIEALFEFSEAHPDLLSVVLTAAKVKHSQRQHIANQRRAQSMMQRFGQT